MIEGDMIPLVIGKQVTFLSLFPPPLFPPPPPFPPSPSYHPSYSYIINTT